MQWCVRVCRGDVSVCARACQVGAGIGAGSGRVVAGLGAEQRRREHTSACVCRCAIVKACRGLGRGCHQVNRSRRLRMTWGRMPLTDTTLHSPSSWPPDAVKSQENGGGRSGACAASAGAVGLLRRRTAIFHDLLPIKRQQSRTAI